MNKWVQQITKNILSLTLSFLVLCLTTPSLCATPYSNTIRYSWVDDPASEAQQVEEAAQRLRRAIANPEYMLKNWVELPTSPTSRKKTIQYLSIREAILLALRYNPNIQDVELERIIQRYQLRLAHNEFELQYALGASGVIQQSTYHGSCNK